MMRRAFLKAVAGLVAALALPRVWGKGRIEPCDPIGQVKIPAGVTLTCPQCGDRIATARRDIYSGTMVRSSEFEAHQVIAGRSFRCAKCEAPYLRNGKVHSTQGWL